MLIIIDILYGYKISSDNYNILGGKSSSESKFHITIKIIIIIILNQEYLEIWILDNYNI